MSGRHSGRTTQGLRVSALPKTIRLVSRLVPRQLNDEIALAKVELKRKGKQLGFAAAFSVAALVFLAFLVTGLIVAAIMGLATVMPAWLAALLVSAVFLLIALIVGLIGYSRFKKAMPLAPQDSIRGIKHDLGIVKEGSDFDPAVLDPASEKARAAKAAKEEAAARAKAEKAAKAANEPDESAVVSESQLRTRLDKRRRHLTGVRDELGEELDVKPQVQSLLAGAQDRLKDGRDIITEKAAVVGTSARSLQSKVNLPSAASLSSAVSGTELEARWKPLTALAASTTVMLVLLRKLFKN
jgi:uncharacterized membrane protein YqjE